MAIIEVRQLIFEYPGLRALDRVSFSLPEHSITALAGPNGAGKTTLMRCLAALERPLAGSIRLGDIDVLEQPRACHQQVGYLSDFFGLYNELTVRQCLRFVAGAYGVEDPPAAIDQALQDLNLEAWQHYRAAELSRGLRQRLGIAQAILHRPRMLLLDEPASGLDPQARNELAGLLVKLKDSGISVMVSSHILAELSEYSTHMLILERGRVVDFSAIGGARPEQVELHIRLARGHENFAGILSRHSAFSIGKLDGLDVVGRFQGDETQQAEFLRALIDGGLEISIFEALNEDMQEVYLRIIQGRNTDAPAMHGTAAHGQS